MSQETDKQTKEIRWVRGRKIIDRWHIKPEDLGHDGAITPIMITDKNGNIWSMGVTRCDLILHVNMVSN
jgi:hypothetical protein